MSELVTAEEANAMYRRAWEETSALVEASPLTEGSLRINLARLYKVHYWEYLSEVYALDLAFQRILAAQEDTEFFYVDRGIPYPGHATLTDAESISGWMISKLGQGGGPSGKVVFHRIAREDSSLGRKVRPLVYSVKKVVREILARFRILLSPSAIPGLYRSTVVGFGTGYDALIVLPDLLRIAAEKGRRPLLMTEGVDRGTLRTGLKWKKEYDTLEQISISKCLALHSMAPLTPAERRSADHAFDEMVRFLNRNAEIRRYRLPETLGGLREDYRRVLQRAKALDRILTRFGGSAFVVTHFNGFDELVIEQRARDRGIETFARPHGWMNSPEAFEYKADHYYCDGPLRAGMVQEVFHYGDRIELSADPSLAGTAEAWLLNSPSERRSIVRDRRRELSIAAHPVILLMTTAARHGRALNEFEYTAWIRCWETIFHYLKNHSDVHVLVKSHKRNCDPWIERQAAQAGVTNLSIRSGRLEDALVLADLVVDFGKPGTATLSALVFQRPLLLYRGVYKYVREFGDRVFNLGTSFCVDSPDDLCAQFERCRVNPEQYGDELVAKNRILLDELFVPRTLPSTVPHRETCRG